MTPVLVLRRVAPAPTTIAAAVFVPEVRSANALLPPPPPSPSASHAVPLHRQWVSAVPAAELTPALSA